MKKIWFFVEGDSEEHFIKNMIRRHYYDVHLAKDELSFINDSFDQHACYCLNVGNVDRIPYDINDYIYKINRSESQEAIIVCDVEGLGCHTARVERIRNNLSDEVGSLNIHCVFFNPSIEKLYWECPNTLKKVLKFFYKRKFGDGTSIPVINLPEITGKYLYNLKELFRQYDLKYRETQFSEEFFPRIDFDQCGNHVIERLIRYVNQILNRAN